MTDLLLFLTKAMSKVMPLRLALGMNAGIMGLTTWLAFMWWRAEGRKIDTCNTVGGFFSQISSQGSTVSCQIAPVLQIVALVACLFFGVQFLFLTVLYITALIRPDFDLDKDLGWWPRGSP